jgi:GT2 family glycosyltransferase
MIRSLAPRVGIIIIGRNEGERLQKAFETLSDGVEALLYVDSGSTDGSVALAQSLNIAVHELDPATPFSAARARNEGAGILLAAFPSLELIQFVDGDCVLAPDWIEKAVAYMDKDPKTGIVCGRLIEANPERSIYNRVTAVRWNAAIGDIDACGGIFMIRRFVFQEVGGFNMALLTGEEAALCANVRKIGFRIVRLDEKMAHHDADIVSFRDWWGRAVWGGYGDAMQYDVLKGKVNPNRRRETRSIYTWVVYAPVMAVLGIVGSIWWPWLMILPLLCLLGYGALIGKIWQDRLRREDDGLDAMLYALFCVLRKFPYAIGFFWYRLNWGGGTRRPDPHAMAR